MSAPSADDAAMAQRFEQACIAMEQAIDPSTRAAADAFLQSFRDTPRPYTLCMLLLQGSAVAHAQYIALGTMKVAIQREGRVLGEGFLVQLKDQLLNCLVAKASSWNNFVTNQCIHVIAILYKWICLIEDESRLRLQQQSKTTIEDRPAYIGLANCVASLLQQGSQAALASAAPNATPAGTPPPSFYTHLALELSKSLINEFTQGTSQSNAGVSVAMHVRCHSSFEQHVLFNLATLILTQCLPSNLSTLNSVASNTPTPALLSSLNLLHSLLSFVDVLLSFPFEDPKHPDQLALRWALVSDGGVGGGSLDSLGLKPSHKWHGVFIQSQLVEMVAHSWKLLSQVAHAAPMVYAAFHKCEETRHLARHALLQLATISGPIFKDPPPAPIDVFKETPQLPTPADGVSRTRLAFVSRIVTSLNGLFEGAMGEASKAPSQLDEEAGKELIGIASIIKRLFWPGAISWIYASSDTSCNIGTELSRLFQFQQSLALLLLPYVADTRLPGPNGKRIVSTDTTKTECFDLVLENWNTILEELSNEDGLKSQQQAVCAQAISQQVRACTGAIFEAYVTQRMRALVAGGVTSVGDGDDDDGDDDEDEEGQFVESSYVDTHLHDVAALGKPHLQAALTLLTQELNGVLVRWQQIVRASSNPATSTTVDTSALYAIHESFYFLLRLLGHLLGGGMSWSDLDSSSRYQSIPSHVIGMLRQDSNGDGIRTLRTTFETVRQITIFIHQLLDYKPIVQTSQGDTIVIQTNSSPLKELCSPLVLESLVWLLQQFVSTGYVMIDQGRHEAAEIELPKSLLELYSGGNTQRPTTIGGPPVYGADSPQLVDMLIATLISFITSYSEEESLMDCTLSLFDLCVKHVPLRLHLRQKLLSSTTTTPSTFQNFFLHNFINYCMIDPYISNHNGAGGGGVMNPFSNLTPTILTQLSNVLLQCLTFSIETDCNDLIGGTTPQQKHAIIEERKNRRHRSFESIHSIFVPMMKHFFRNLMHSNFVSQKLSSHVLKSLTTYVSFFNGCVKDLFVDNFDLLWNEVTMSDSMVQIPTNGTSIGQIEASIGQLNQFAQTQGVQQMRIHAAGNGTTEPNKQNLLDTLIELVRQYNTDDVILRDESGTSLQLCSSILYFFRDLIECFLPYLNQSQSFRMLQSTLSLVNVYVTLMDRRSAASAHALRSSTHQRKTEVLTADAAALATAEWNILDTLLQLLESVSSKDLVDLSSDSVDFASDAVLNGLMLLIPRLTGNMLARPNIASLFFKLLSALVTTNPDKLASVLNENQRNQLLAVISFVFESEAPITASAASTPAAQRSVLAVSASAELHGDLLREVCAAVQAISQYHLYFVSGKAESDQREAAMSSSQSGHRGLRSSAPPPPSPFAGACVSFLRSILRVLLHAHLSPPLLDPLADALLPTILAQPNVFMEQVREIIDGWKAKQSNAYARLQQTLGADAAAIQQHQMESLLVSIESGFQQLIPSSLARTGVTGTAARTHQSSRSMAVERSERMMFRKQMREFVLTVRPLMTTREG